MQASVAEQARGRTGWCRPARVEAGRGVEADGVPAVAAGAPRAGRREQLRHRQGDPERARRGEPGRVEVARGERVAPAGQIGEARGDDNPVDRGERGRRTRAAEDRRLAGRGNRDRRRGGVPGGARTVRGELRVRAEVTTTARAGATAADAAGWVAGTLARPAHVVVLALGANDGLRRGDIRSMTAAPDAIIRPAQGASAEVVLAGMEAPPAHGAATPARCETASADWPPRTAWR